MTVPCTPEQWSDRKLGAWPRPQWWKDRPARLELWPGKGDPHLSLVDDLLDLSFEISDLLNPTGGWSCTSLTPRNPLCPGHLWSCNTDRLPRTLSPGHLESPESVDPGARCPSQKYPPSVNAINRQISHMCKHLVFFKSYLFFLTVHFSIDVWSWLYFRDFVSSCDWLVSSL